MFGGGYGGGSTAARDIVRQLRLAASAATAVFGVLNDQAVDTLYRGLGVELKSGTVLSCQDLVAQDAFAVGLELPCSEAGMAVDQPPLGLSFVSFGLPPPLPPLSLVC